MTLPHLVPQGFEVALQDFGLALQENFSSAIPANPEDQLKAPVQNLLHAAAANVQTRSEAQVEGLGARPDIGVGVRNLLCGFVELKAPGSCHSQLKMSENLLRNRKRKTPSMSCQCNGLINHPCMLIIQKPMQDCLLVQLFSLRPYYET